MATSKTERLQLEQFYKNASLLSSWLQNDRQIIGRFLTTDLIAELLSRDNVGAQIIRPPGRRIHIDIDKEVLLLIVPYDRKI